MNPLFVSCQTTLTPAGAAARGRACPARRSCAWPRQIKAVASAAAAAAALLAAPGAQAAPHAHEHGVARLDVSIDGGTLTLMLSGPLDGFVGFERAPRSDAERQLAATTLTRLRDGAALFKPEAAAQCTLAAAQVNAPVLEGKAVAQGEHADLDAEYRFNCSQPQQLKGVDLALFDSFKRLQRLNVQVAAGKGQAAQVLKRPAKRVALVR